MITPHQIRAARAILEWSIDDLAKKTGLNRDTIHNIEKGRVLARQASAEKIKQVFLDNGIEFIGERGVAQANENYRILEGPDCYLRLLDEVYHSLAGKKGAEVLFFCVDDSVSPKEVVEMNWRILNAGIKCRYLCPEKPKRIDYNPDDYRCIPKKFYLNNVVLVFGNKTATVRKDRKSALIVRDKENANFMRGLFELIWKNSSKLKIEKKR